MSPGEIWVVAEFRRDGLTRVSEQLVGAARDLAAHKELTPLAVLIGGEKSQAEELTRLAPHVLWVDNPALTPYEANRHVVALSKLIDSRGAPAAILAGASAAGLEFMPGLAARLRAAYLSSCTRLWWEGEQLAVRRAVFGGRVYEEFVVRTSPAVLTVRPGAFPRPEPLTSPGELESAKPGSTEFEGPKVTQTRSTTSGGRDLSEASRVVAGGRGLGSPENFQLIEQLAEALDASVGASRSVVDAGWRPHDEQVGKSGKTISPELYVACGISGAIHHVLGMNTAKVVVAINTDAEAPIFQSADFGVVGDANQVVPELIRELGRK
jgi:electron transfer flavoprotein alpha subunit